ncbi:MAG: TolC family protein [Planctomycetes bacterium]|nr:TolC family protein [Planctomycetota bacterium]
MSQVGLCLALVVLAQDPPAAPRNPGRSEQDPARLLGPDRALSITLEGAYQLALRRNIDLQIAATESQIATYRARGSWGAFDWVLGARAAYRDAEFQPQNVFGGGSEENQDFGIDLTKPTQIGGTFRFGFDSSRSDTTSSFSVIPQSTTDIVSLSYVQPLLRNGWQDYATSIQELAELEAQRSDQGVRRARQQMLVDVASAYWDLVAAREQLDVAEKSLELAQAQVDQDRRRFEAGLGTELDVLQAQADVALREEQRLLRDFEVRTAADGLRKLLFPGTDTALWDTALVPGTPLPEQTPTDAVPAWASAMETAIARRPELREQRTRIQEAEVRHRRAQVDKKPQLDLDLTASSQGFATSEGEAFETAAAYDYPTYRASLVFGLPIGNTTARFAEKATWAEIRRARLEYDRLETSVVADVRTAVRDVLFAAESVRATRKSLELSQRQLAAEQARHAVDQSTNFQLLQFQTDLATAMSSERRARVAYARSLVRLQAAQGVLGDDLAP